MRPLVCALLFLAGCPGPPPGDAGPDGGDAPPADAGPLPALVINEVMSRNGATLLDDLFENDDWVELHNAGDEPIDLAGFAVTDDEGDPDAYVLPDTELSPGGYFLFFADGQPEQGPLHASFRLAGGGEALILRAPDGRVVEVVQFGELAVDQSAGRSPDGAGPFAVLASPSPRSANGPHAARDEPAAAGVVINEILALNVTGFPDGSGTPEDWVELLNTSTEAQDLSFHHLSDALAAPFQFTFPAGTVLEPGGFLIVFLDGQPEEGDLHAGFGLSGDGDALFLTSPDGATVLDQHLFEVQTPDVSLARVPDGTGDFVASTPTPGAANAP